MRALRRPARLYNADVLVGWELRREAAPPDVEERAQLEERCSGIEMCALEYDALPADMCDSREYDALEEAGSRWCAPGSTPTLANCRAAGRSRASVARLLGLNEFCATRTSPIC